MAKQVRKAGNSMEVTITHNGKDSKVELPIEKDALFKRKKSDAIIEHRSEVGGDKIFIKGMLGFDHENCKTTLKIEIDMKTLIAYGQHGKPIMLFMDKLLTAAMDETNEYLAENWNPQEEDPDQQKLWD